MSKTTAPKGKDKTAAPKAGKPAGLAPKGLKMIVATAGHGFRVYAIGNRAGANGEPTKALARVLLSGTKGSFETVDAAAEWGAGKFKDAAAIAKHIGGMGTNGTLLGGGNYATWLKDAQKRVIKLGG
jgi:hypothetical protein